MKIVRTFATSANIGPGFDTLGICYDVYNEYSFEIVGKFTVQNKQYYLGRWRWLVNDNHFSLLCEFVLKG